MYPRSDQLLRSNTQINAVKKVKPGTGCRMDSTTISESEGERARPFQKTRWNFLKQMRFGLITKGCSNNSMGTQLLNWCIEASLFGKNKLRISKKPELILEKNQPQFRKISYLYQGHDNSLIDLKHHKHCFVKILMSNFFMGKSPSIFGDRIKINIIAFMKIQFLSLKVLPEISQI